MIKRLLFPLCIVSIILSSSYYVEDVTVNIEVPAEVQAGEDFEVTITLDKNELDGFARIYQDLPAGLNASQVSNANADFSFSDQRIRFLWLRLPSDQKITLVYKVQVNERLKGVFNIPGEFSFIQDNIRESLRFESQSIAILPSPNIAEDRIVDVRNFAAVLAKEQEYESLYDKIAVIRETPDISNPDQGIVVNLMVSKEELSKFAKVEEIIPKGYDVSVIEGNNAIFSYTDQVIKFLWMKLPEEPYFKISYRLVPIQNQNIDQLNIAGKFSYLVGEETKTAEVFQEDVKLKELSNTEIDKMIRELKKIPEIDYNKLAEDADIQDEIKIPEPQQKTIIPQKPLKSELKIPDKLASYSKSDVLDPGPGVSYRVQVAAGHKPVLLNSYFSKYNLDNQVKIEYHDGWLKYSVGSFDVYKKARDYRINVWNSTTIDDAFVLAYNDGKRITVQEALMISHQEWFK